MIKFILGPDCSIYIRTEKIVYLKKNASGTWIGFSAKDDEDGIHVMEDLDTVAKRVKTFLKWESRSE